MRRSAAWVAAALPVAALLVACSDPELPAEALPCDVDVVLRDVCQRCHSRPPRAGVPISLVTYADTQATLEDPRGGKNVATFEVMGELLRAGLMPEPPTTITNGQKNVLLTWIDDGAPSAPADTRCP